jgi:hypothetical protein
MGTYRVDRDLLAAVAVRATERGETVTDVIIQRFEAYIRDDEAAPIALAPSVGGQSVYTHHESQERYEEVNDDSPCRHPAEAVEAGECRACGADVF